MKYCHASRTQPLTSSQRRQLCRSKLWPLFHFCWMLMVTTECSKPLNFQKQPMSFILIVSKMKTLIFFIFFWKTKLPVWAMHQSDSGCVFPVNHWQCFVINLQRKVRKQSLQWAFSWQLSDRNNVFDQQCHFRFNFCSLPPNRHLLSTWTTRDWKKFTQSLKTQSSLDVKITWLFIIDYTCYFCFSSNANRSSGSKIWTSVQAIWGRNHGIRSEVEQICANTPSPPTLLYLALNSVSTKNNEQSQRICKIKVDTFQ